MLEAAWGPPAQSSITFSSSSGQREDQEEGVPVFSPWVGMGRLKPR